MPNCPKSVSQRLYLAVPFVFISLTLLTLLSGCNNGQLPTAEVNGKVVYRGQPLTSGSVLFQPKNGPTACGTIQKDGTFTLSTYADGDGAVLGMHQVQITCYAPLPPGMGETALGKSLVPKKYTRYDTSKLEANVESENAPFVFELHD